MLKIVVCYIRTASKIYTGNVIVVLIMSVLVITYTYKRNLNREGIYLSHGFWFKGNL